MNCKEGDLAIIVKSYAGNEGKIVRCVRFIGYYEFVEGPMNNIWITDTKLKGMNNTYDDKIADEQLRPIRDSDKQDEMLNIIKIKEPINA